MACANPQCITGCEPQRGYRYCSRECHAASRKQGPCFIVCENPKCQAVKDVKKRSEQKIRRFCSQRCANAINQNVKKFGQKGGLERGRRIRARIREKVGQMQPLEAFRYGYTLGLQSKTRQLQNRRQKVVDRKDAAA